MSEFNLQESPIRKIINNLEEDQLSVFEDGTYVGDGEEKRYKGIQARVILNDVENMLDVMKGHSQEVVRIAVMGEVKAGKSTFINTLLGKEVAYTDILEATALVSEITYSDNEYVQLIGRDGSIVRECSLQDMLSWMEDMVDDEGDFSIYEKIVIGVPIELLKNLIIVDTPGLFSITSQNRDITNAYIAETDYILWVINSCNLGSKVVNDYIDKIHLSGKPMIGIISKVDSESVKEEIEKYIMAEYSSIFEDIFFVSSKVAMELKEDNDDEWVEKSGFEDLYDCIEEISEDKEHSTNKTQYYQLQRDKEVHVKMREKINERKGYYDNEIATFSYVNNEIKKTIKSEIQNWCRNDFFVNERQELLNASDKDFSNVVSKYSDPVYITELIENKYNEIAKFIYQKWNIVTESLTLKSSQVIVDFSYDKQLFLEDEETTKIITQNYNEARIKEGVKTGAAVGVAFAGYWAWLGPAALSATFMSSLVPCTIPFVVAGVVLSGLVQNGIDGNVAIQNAKKKQEYVDDLYKEVTKIIVKESNNMENALCSCSDYYYKEKCDEYKQRTSQFNFDFTEPSFGNFITALDTYIEKVNAQIESLERIDVPEPPKTDE